MPPQIIKKTIGESYEDSSVVLKGICSFCKDNVTFRQVGGYSQSPILVKAVAIRCEGCGALQVYSISKNKIYPEPIIKGLEGLPEHINKYYEEALRCIAYDCPNGAMTLFRKLIHQLGIHYNVAQKNDNKELYKIINELKDAGHIQEKLRKALLETKDFGNDGAHGNDSIKNQDDA